MALIELIHSTSQVVSSQQQVKTTTQNLTPTSPSNYINISKWLKSQKNHRGGLDWQVLLIHSTSQVGSSQQQQVKTTTQNLTPTSPANHIICRSKWLKNQTKIIEVGLTDNSPANSLNFSGWFCQQQQKVKTTTRNLTPTSPSNYI